MALVLSPSVWLLPKTNSAMAEPAWAERLAAARERAEARSLLLAKLVSASISVPGDGDDAACCCSLVLEVRQPHAYTRRGAGGQEQAAIALCMVPWA